MAIINGTAQNDVLNGTDDNDTIRGFRGNDTLFGGGGDDFLSGGPGNDRLDGNRGADRMLGDVGNDLYYVDDERDIVTESQPGRVGGIDRVFASVEFILGDNLEHLTMYGTGFLGRGNDLANIIRGNASDNYLQGLGGNDVIFGGAGIDLIDGGQGADMLIGGRGDDFLSVDSRLDVVIEGRAGGIDTLDTSHSRRLDANIENLILGDRARNAVGNELDNEITGNSAANVILGGLGDDTLSGGKGDDNLRGGNGDDVINGGSVETETIYFEDGQTEADRIAFYDDGADFIDGGSGSDTLIYTDLFSRDTEIDFNGGKYIDSSINLEQGTAEWLLPGLSKDVLTSIENVTLANGNDTVFGSVEDNIITLNTGKSDVFAGAGDDTILGGYWFHEGVSDFQNVKRHVAEVLRGGDGDDLIDSGGSVYSRVYIDPFSPPAKIFITRAKDVLFGDAGDDQLLGGAGYITMVGGEGADTFEFFDNTWVDARDSMLFISGDISHVTDFDPTEGDSVVINRENPETAPATTYVGETDSVGVGELGYQRIVRGDRVHTVIQHGFAPDEEDYGSDPAGTDVLYSTIFLDNYAGPIVESDFLFV